MALPLSQAEAPETFALKSDEQTGAQMTLDVCLCPLLLPKEIAPGTVVIAVDVLRATSTMIAACDAGVAAIIPVISVEDARQMVENTPGALLVGEVASHKPEGFDYGNSPAELCNPAAAAGKTLVMRSTNGTRLLHHVLDARAQTVWMGSFTNLNILIKTLRAEPPNHVLIACGGHEDTPSLEDTAFAGALLEGLLTTQPLYMPTDAAQMAIAAWAHSGRDIAAVFDRATHAHRLIGHGKQADMDAVRTAQYAQIPVLDPETRHIRPWRPHTPTTRYCLTLPTTDLEHAPMLEEWLWTLPGVESVSQDLDGESELKSVSVMSTSPEIAGQVHTLLREQIPADGLMNALGIWTEMAIPAQAQVIAEEDWAESWKQYWHVSHLLPNLVIRPSWEPYTAQPGEIVLDLDPGCAFGTGTHETTQLMLAALSQVDNPAGKALLDVGTGSGILALYAAKRGFSPVVGLDNDSVAVTASRENALRNGLGTLQFAVTLLAEHPAPEGGYAVIVANILAGVLCEMMPDLAQRLQLSGRLFLSGITRHQLPQMHEALAANGLELLDVQYKGDWLGLAATR